MTILEQIEELDLRGTALTDAGLEQFPILPRLQRIYLVKTNVTDDGIAVLRHRLGRWTTLSISW
ncbi:MAG TPA: hypothetical protein VHC22_02410 [Pirellulales bacterium]|nr:hypothetical protein [Pirellulales bacterium]